MFPKFSALFLLLQLAACSSLLPPSDKVDVTKDAWTRAPVVGNVPPEWQHYEFPGKTATQFSYARKDGRDVMAAYAPSSASVLRQKIHVAPHDLGRLKFSWKVPELIAHADLAGRDAADSPVRILLAFEGDRSRFSAKNAMLSELSHALTGEPLPYATLMYVWCNTRVPGSVIVSPRTDRIRKLVVESGEKNLNQWLDYERDIRADFEKAFGEPPGALVGIGIMTDSDNTRSTTQAWYGQLRLSSTNAYANRATDAPKDVMATRQ